MRTNEAFVVNPQEGRPERSLDVFGNQIWIKLGSDDTDGSYAIMEGTVPPESGPPMHRHNREDESWQILEGQFLFMVDGKEILAGPGCTVHAPRGTTHTFQNIGSTEGRLLTIVQPAGLDLFFAEIDHACGGMAKPDMTVVLSIFEKYGLELIGPPLSVRSDAVKLAS